MFRLSVLILGALILKLDLSQASSTFFIVGGKDARIIDYPYQVSLHEYSTFYCGGSLVSPQLILTAAHCLKKRRPESITVRAGSSYTTRKGQVRRVAKFYFHPKYNPAGLDYDVALMLLRRPFHYDKSIKIIRISSTIVPDGTLATVTGFGNTQFKGQEAKQLQVLQVSKLSDELCTKLYPGMVSLRMSCYGFIEGIKDSCQGDSGGPLVLGDKQVGIVSWGRGCAIRNNPGTYTDLLDKDIRQFLKKFIAGVV